MSSQGNAPAEGPSPAVLPEPSRRSVYLAPGQLFASAEPAEASTILGSCVAVCLWDARSRAGGANHFLLPDWAESGSASPRYGNVAIERLVHLMEGLGAPRRSLQAKLFGGAAVLEAFRGRVHHLGARNVELARRLLGEIGIPIVAEDVGGNRGRKVIFRTDCGLALVRLI
jgi:chemotaxis protein CheD